MKPIDIGLIQARRMKIEADIASETQRHEKIVAVENDRFEQAIAPMKAEAHELEIAEKVFAKLTLDDVPPSKDANGHAEAAQPEEGKPIGTPPMPEMIKEALAHAHGLGAPILAPTGILSYVQGKYWPGATLNNVGPIAWRMWNRGDLEKATNGGYALLKAERDKLMPKIERRI